MIEHPIAFADGIARRTLLAIGFAALATTALSFSHGPSRWQSGEELAFRATPIDSTETEVRLSAATARCGEAEGATRDLQRPTAGSLEDGEEILSVSQQEFYPGGEEDGRRSIRRSVAGIDAAARPPGNRFTDRSLGLSRPHQARSEILRL